MSDSFYVRTPNPVPEGANTEPTCSCDLRNFPATRRAAARLADVAVHRIADGASAVVSRN